MNTLQQKIAAANEVNELALNFAQHYFAEYAYVTQVNGYYPQKLSPSYYEDEVSIDYYCDEGTTIGLKWTFELGSYGNYDTVNRYVQVPVDVLEAFLINPEETIKELVLKHTEEFRKRLEQEKILEEEKKQKEIIRKQEARREQYLKLKEEFEKE